MQNLYITGVKLRAECLQVLWFTLSQPSRKGLSHSSETLFLCGLLRVSGYVCLFPVHLACARALRALMVVHDSDQCCCVPELCCVCLCRILSSATPNLPLGFPSLTLVLICCLALVWWLLLCWWIVQFSPSLLCLPTVGLCQREGGPCLCCHPPGWLSLMISCTALPPLLCDPQILQGAMARVQGAVCSLSASLVLSAPKLIPASSAHFGFHYGDFLVACSQPLLPSQSPTQCTLAAEQKWFHSP